MGVHIPPPSLLLFQKVQVFSALTDANVSWDNVSTRCLITHTFAKANHLYFVLMLLEENHEMGSFKSLSWYRMMHN